MGDWSDSLGMNSIKRLIEDNTPDGMYVHSLKIGGDGSGIDSHVAERIAGFLGKANDQVQEACDYIASDPNLADGYHALGFSQGGQFLRAVAQRCPNPPMKNLVTMGAQHQGVFGFPGCPGEDLVLCELMRQLLNLGAYIEPIQNILIQAQYWHDPLHYETYVNSSQFIGVINNEDPNNFDSAFAENLSQLENFVMIMFGEDTTVEPIETQHFAFYTPGQDQDIQPLTEAPIYTEDRIGLRALDEAGKLVYLTIPGVDHMQIPEEWFIENVVVPYFN